MGGKTVIKFLGLAASQRNITKTFITCKSRLRPPLYNLTGNRYSNAHYSYLTFIMLSLIMPPLCVIKYLDIWMKPPPLIRICWDCERCLYTSGMSHLTTPGCCVLVVNSNNVFCVWMIVLSACETEQKNAEQIFFQRFHWSPALGKLETASVHSKTSHSYCSFSKYFFRHCCFHNKQPKG